MGERIVFFFAAAAALGCGVGVIALKNPFRAAVALIGTLVSVAVLFLLMAAPFVAAIQIIVYAGAIVVLFLFVIAYLGERPSEMPADPLGRGAPFAWIAVLGLAIPGFVALANTELPRVRANPVDVGDLGDPKRLGHAFVDTFTAPFEATSLILLVAAVAAVLLAKRAVQGEGGR